MNGTTYPTADEFKDLLFSRPLTKLVDDRIFSGVPFAFRRRIASEVLLRELLSNSLGVTAADITVVGSGRVGFSLKPTTFGRKYSSRSDIDVVVVSAALFDTVWL